MAQTLLTPQIITMKALESLENNLVMAKLVHRSFESYYQKIGATLTVRKPNKFQVQDGPTINVQPINEPSVSITVDKFKTVPFEFTDSEMALTVDDFAARYIEPAMIPLANQIDYDLLSLANQFSNVVGTPGSTPSTFATSVQLTGQRLDENAAPQQGRNLVVNPAAAWSMAGAQSNAFVTRVSEKALINGYLNVIGNQSIFNDQNVQSTTASTYGGTPKTNAVTAQTGASLITDGWTATTTTLAAGTVFTIDGVYAVNPVSFQSTGQLKNFRVTTATVTDGAGNSTIAIDPPIITSGPFQNVTNGAANDKNITVLTGASGATAVNNLAFTKEAMGLIMVPLEIPKGMDMAYVATHKNISIRFVRGFDITNAQFISRLDVLYGVAKYYDELGVRLLG